jgi:uncharacterized protein YkwD
MRPTLTVLLFLGPLALASCENRVVSTATNVGLAAATVASPTLAPVTAPVLAARMVPKPASAAPSPAPAPATPTPPIAAATTEAGLLPLINRFRATEGLPPLSANPALSGAALTHAFDMAANGFVSHTGTDGSSVGTRARSAGCNWSSVAENIAVGQPDAAGVVVSWTQSPNQRRNLVDEFTDFGEARVGNHWVAVYSEGC